MFGWEFPPYNSGGLGVACEGLVRGLVNQGVKITFVLPKKVDCQSSLCKIIFADFNIKSRIFNSLLSPYLTSKSYQDLVRRAGRGGIYRRDLISEVLRYGQAGRRIALAEDFDLIHSHDWLSFPAGLAAKKISHKSLVAHIHATEFERTGGHHVNQEIYEIEKEGLSKADMVIAVSNLTKTKIIQHYGIEPEKVRVVHNAVEYKDFMYLGGDLPDLKSSGQKIVAFVGRITLQKGPDYFLRAAKKVLDQRPNVLFIIAGAGDMERQIIEQAAWLDIADKVLFAGFLRGNELAKVYQMADLYVLSSVSDPFGMTPLEALANGTPVLISKQSGVAEVLHHCLKVDFWDIDQMANKILAVLEQPELYQCLKENGHQEVRKLSWQDAANKCIEVYKEVLNFSAI